MNFGNKAVDGGHLRMSRHEVADMELERQTLDKLIIRRILGSADFIRGEERYCLWIEDENLSLALSYPKIAARVQRTKEARLSSPDESANLMAARAHQFREMRCPRKYSIVLPRITSEAREYLPAGIAGKDAVLSSQNFALYDEPILGFLVSPRLKTPSFVDCHVSAVGYAKCAFLIPTPCAGILFRSPR